MMRTMEPDAEHLERLLARDTRAYLDGSGEKTYPSLSSCLEYLLQWHWHAKGLSRYRWFDGLEGALAKVVDDRRLEVRGLMTFGDQGREQYVDVFEAELCLSKDRYELEDYTLRFGRKGLETHRVPYSDASRMAAEMRGADWDWAYIFTRQDARG